ncbi:D-alanyl-D-alanine carboxypeptidase/D-alanyl-D-alanine endopeptidase [Acidimangrovimonas pyrenivorans]|uniref:D-alanyl-D-alanine carboxypeptidase/D-alanyl-D-alanine-endopeptidase n=1 Tax=Acidimangrovimonas pyrenivorans TaxID=2030798 RepID=A0ABV7AIK6_9RHOB
MEDRPHSFSRRWLLGALLSGAALPALAGAPARSPRPEPRPGRLSAASSSGSARPAVPSAAALVNEARLGGTVGFVVADARSGAVLESRHADTALPPGSVTKIFTTLYALDRLGPDYRFATRLIATGPVIDGRIQGDLILAGGGDPTLDTDALGDLTTSLRAKGVRGVSGRFLFDASALPPIPEIDPGQPAQAGYNPGLSGLNLNFNRVYFEWKRGAEGYSATMDARGLRYRPAVGGIDIAVVDRPAPLYTYGERGGKELWTVARGALGRGGGRWLPVRHPARYTAEVFRTLAAAQSIALPAPQPASLPGVPPGASGAGTVLASHRSAPLTEVLREMLKYSTNLTAETIGLTASAAGGTAPASLSASAAQMATWARDRYGIAAHFTDHSGLGSGTRVTAAELVRLLAAANANAPLRELLKTVRLRDARGRPIRNSPIQIRAKTGTLNFVSGLAGYVAAPGDTQLIFAILTADVPRRDALPASARERPPGGRSWLRRARHLQQELITRWSTVYAGRN